MVFEGAYFYPWAVIEINVNRYAKLLEYALGTLHHSFVYTKKQFFKEMMTEIVTYNIRKKVLDSDQEKFLKISVNHDVYPITIFCRHDKYESNDDRYSLFARKV